MGDHWMSHWELGMDQLREPRMVYQRVWGWGLGMEEMMGL